MGKRVVWQTRIEKKRAMSRRRKKILAVCVLISAVLLLIAFNNRAALSEKLTYEIASSSEVRYTPDGGMLVIDNGKTTLLQLDANGRLLHRWDGGAENTPFFYACHAVQTADGSIYVADITYGDRGNLLDSERVLRFDGKEWSTLFEVDYTTMPIEETPMQYGRILELDEHDGKVWFVRDMVSGVVLYELSDDGASFSHKERIEADFVKIDAAYDPDSGSFVFLARNGVISEWTAADGMREILPSEQEMIPYDAAIRNGTVYYTELANMSIHSFPLGAPEQQTEYARLDSMPYKLNVSADDSSIAVTDYAGFYHVTADGPEYVESAKVSYAAYIIVIWIVLILGALAAIYPVFCAVRRLGTLVIEQENAMRVLLIVVASLVVSAVIAYSLLNQILASDTSASKNQVQLIAQMLTDKIDVKSLKTLDRPSDYNTEAFLKVKAPLDESIIEAYEREDYYYYVIYRAKGDMIDVIMDFEDTQPCTYPLYDNDPEANDYAAVLAGGDEVLVSEISAFGAWTFLLSPIMDENGDVIALLEVGQGLGPVQNRQNETRRELVVNTAISTVVMTMLLLELTFLFSYVERKRGEGGGVLDSTDRVPLRTLMFLIYVSDSMQDAFIAILCAQLYEGTLPLPSGVAVALPMSAQLLTMAVLSFLAGRLAERFGSRKCLSVGMAIQLSGFLCCLILGSYTGLLLGKMLIGAGMGLVYVSCNTVASSGADEKKVSAAFADVSAGTLSGLTIGAGLASVLLSIGGWRLIYLVGAIIAGFGLMLAVTSGDVRAAKGENAGDAGEKSEISFKEFFFNRRVGGYFLLVLVPFMMALSYREYFFPLFAQESGISEIRISQIYLMCGMLVLYIGPALSSWLLEHLAPVWSVVLASGMMAALMLIFVIRPTLDSVITGVVILSVVISFAYTCQYTYFDLTGESTLYGDGRSMGVYSVFESLGQTIGPLAYGAFLSLGYVRGIGILSAVLLLLAAAFVILTLRSPKDVRAR